MQEPKRKISLVKERILQYIEIQGISNYKFYALTGIAYGSLSKPGGITDDGLVKICNRFVNLNPEWVLLGTGPIERTKSDENVIIEDKAKNDNKNDNILYHKQKVTKMLSLMEESGLSKYSHDPIQLHIPLIPSRTFSIIQSEPDLNRFEMYRIPGLQEADFLIPYYGEDMAPTVAAGNIVAGKIIPKAPFYTWGRIHMFELETYGIVMGRLQPGSTGESIKCEPENKGYQTIEVPIENIVAVAMLMAVIKILK